MKWRTEMFETVKEALEYIAECIDYSEAWSDEYDLQGIFEEICEFTEVYEDYEDEDGNPVLSHYGYRLVVSDEEFWDAVENNEITR